MRLLRVVVAACLVLSCCSGGPAFASDVSKDWPGWRNADRSGRSNDTNLLKQWPSGGPKLLWKVEGLGTGYSTPSVVGGIVYLMGTKGDNDVVFAVNAKTHKVMWSTIVGEATKGGGYPGARATPTIDGSKLYTLGSGGSLVCLDTKKGKKVWSTNLRKDFGGVTGSWDYAESPLIDGDVCVVSPGGKGTAMVALNKANGKEIWRSNAPDAGVAAYASAIVADFNGKKQYIQFMSKSLFAVDAETGKQLWSYEKCANRVANCPTPIYHDGYVFCASGYNTGGGLVKLKADGSQITAEEVYFQKKMNNHHGCVVLVDGHLYGTHQQALICMDFLTGKVKWEDRSVGKGSITYADGHLYVRSENGPIALVEANPEKYVEKGRFQQPHRSNTNAWCHPVVTGGKMYIRDADILLCYNVAAK